MPITLTDAPKRHSVATLLAIWMFAYSATAVIYNLMLYFPLAFVWGSHSHVPPVRLWTASILYTLGSVLDLLPTPDQLFGLREAVRRVLDLPNTYSFGREVVFRLVLLMLPLTLGYGILRMRKWARWGYASLYVLTVGLWPFGWSRHHGLTTFGTIPAISQLILAIALIVFLYRRGLTVKPIASRRLAKPQ